MTNDAGTALALPDPSAIAVGRAHEVLAQVVEWAGQADDADQVLEALRWTQAVERLLAPRKAQGPAQTASRLLEARIGELDEPETGGRGKRHAHGTLSRSRRYEYRLMAEYRDLWAGRLPLSRSRVLALVHHAMPRWIPTAGEATGMDLRQGDFRTVLGEDFSLMHAVDLVVTDPPYSPDYLPLWEDLSGVASFLLKPGGLLLAMGGPMYMLDFLEALSTRLEYRWTIAWLMLGGVETNQYDRRVASKWKPVFVFSHGVGHSDWISDVVNAGNREKGLHDWQQSEAGFLNLLKAVRAQPGHLVCDPFLGSGTTAAAARSLGCDFVGAELDRATYESARARLGVVSSLSQT